MGRQRAAPRGRALHGGALPAGTAGIAIASQDRGSPAHPTEQLLAMAAVMIRGLPPAFAPRRPAQFVSLLGTVMSFGYSIAALILSSYYMAHCEWQRLGNLSGSVCGSLSLRRARGREGGRTQPRRHHTGCYSRPLAAPATTTSPFQGACSSPQATHKQQGHGFHHPSPARPAADGADGSSVGGIPMSSSDKTFAVLNACGDILFAVSSCPALH